MAAEALNSPQVSAGDAVMAFVGMLTSLPYVVPFGAAAWATPGVRLAAAFNEANGLEVSGDFPDGLIFPKIEGPLLATVTSAAQSEKAQEQMTPQDAACQILARAPAQYTYWEKRVWREGVIAGTRIATKPLERELAINLARQSALAHRSQHDYLPQSPEAAATWQPHAWVLLAIQAAAIGSPATHGDRAALAYLMQQFDAETWQCPQCGHAEDTATMDSAEFLRNYLAENPVFSATPAAAPAGSLSPLSRIADAFGVTGTWDQIADAVIARGIPAAPGIDLEQFRPAVEQYRLHAQCRRDERVRGVDWDRRIEEADRLLTLIDASPKGELESWKRGTKACAEVLGQVTRQLADSPKDSLNEPFGSAEGFDVGRLVRDCCEAEKADPDHPDTICISVEALTEIAQRHAPQDSPKGGSEAADHANKALAHLSNALEDLESSPDQRPVPLIREAMWHVRQMQAGNAPAYTTGHCENHKKPGGCPLHNLQCGYPQCDRLHAGGAEVQP